MNKWKPCKVLGVLIIWIAFSVLFGLLSGVCFITVTESMSVKEQEVKAEQTESSVSVYPTSIYPTPKEARTIVFEEDDIAFCYNAMGLGRWEGKVFVDSIEFLSDSLYKVHGTRYCFEMDKFIEHIDYLSSLDLKPYYAEGYFEETLKFAKESWRNSILAEDEQNQKRIESSDGSNFDFEGYYPYYNLQ